MLYECRYYSENIGCEALKSLFDMIKTFISSVKDEINAVMISKEFS